MKAKSLHVMLLMLLAAPCALSQNESKSACASCAEKALKIQDLEKQIRLLKGEPATPASTEPAESHPPSEVYTVVAGDSWAKIASKAQCKANELAELNGLTTDSLIHPGQKLKLPSGSTITETTSPATSPLKTYKVQNGETYYSIARKLSIPLDALTAANPNTKATTLYTGRTINLPRETTQAEATVSQATPETTDPEPTTKAETEPAPAPQKKVVRITVETQISYADFAAKYGTDTKRLNQLNGLDLSNEARLAKGSEIYVPAQP